MISFIGRGPLPFEEKRPSVIHGLELQTACELRNKKKASAADINSAALTFKNHIALL